MGLQRTGIQHRRLLIGLGGFLEVAEFVIGHAQIEPVLEPVGGHLRERVAVARGGRKVAFGEGQGGHGLGGHGRIRLQFDEHLRVTPHGDVVLLLQEHGHQVGNGFLAARIAGQHLAVQLHRFGGPSGLLQRHALAEQRLFVIGEQAEVLLDRLQGLGGAAGMDQRNSQP